MRRLSHLCAPLLEEGSEKEALLGGHWLYFWSGGNQAFAFSMRFAGGSLTASSASIKTTSPLDSGSAGTHWAPTVCLSQAFPYCVLHSSLWSLASLCVNLPHCTDGTWSLVNITAALDFSEHSTKRGSQNTVASATPSEELFWNHLCFHLRVYVIKPELWSRIPWATMPQFDAQCFTAWHVWEAAGWAPT